MTTVIKFGIFHALHLWCMRSLLLVLIGTSIILQSLSKITVLIGFQLNRDYISKTLCVQKDKKVNRCKGACHLKKQLDAEKKKEENSNSVKDTEFQMFCQNNSNFNFNISLIPEKGFIPYKTKKVVSTFISVFHPPKA